MPKKNVPLMSMFCIPLTKGHCFGISKKLQAGEKSIREIEL